MKPADYYIYNYWRCYRWQSKFSIGCDYWYRVFRDKGPSRGTPRWLPFIGIEYHPCIPCDSGVLCCLLPLVLQYRPGSCEAFVPKLDVISCRQGNDGFPAGRGVAVPPNLVLPAVVDLIRLQLALIRHPFERGVIDLPEFVPVTHTLYFRISFVPTPPMLSLLVQRFGVALVHVVVCQGFA